MKRTLTKQEAPVVELTGIGYRKGNCHILRDVNWTVAQNEHWVILGANGSGKTTLLRVIAGYVWPQSGSVRVMDNLYGQTDLPALRKRIGWVTSFLKRQLRGHETALEVALSGFDASIGIYREFSEEEWAAAGAALAALGCENLANQPFGTLSQGERQRVLLARGLVHRPDLLILDEPCSGLDPLATRRFLSDLENLAAQENSPTLVLVTHHLEEIAPFVSKALLMKEGRILASGKLKTVLRAENLSEAFGQPCEARRSGSAYHLHWK